MFIPRPINNLPRKVFPPQFKPLTPREEAILAPQRPANGLPDHGQGPALPPAGPDPAVQAMDESLLGTVLRKRPGPYGY